MGSYAGIDLKDRENNVDILTILSYFSILKL
jgi:hypothetical protein